MYKVDSPDAVDFINHQEIIETLEYARAHRNDRELIRNLIEKARLCKGLTHREAAILLECAEEDLTKEIFILPKRSSKNSTATASSCLLRFTYPTIVSMVVCTARIISKIKPSSAKS